MSKKNQQPEAPEEPTPTVLRKEFDSNGHVLGFTLVPVEEGASAPSGEEGQ